MKYLDEYRDADGVKQYARAIRNAVRHEWRIMEICGGQTHAILRYGLDTFLPKEIALVHGPGCPVCVTPVEQIDKAVRIAKIPGTIFCSFGDMLRVPGTMGDLYQAKSEGGDVRVVYSPLDAIKIAECHPDRQVVFFAVGFETTAPANAMAVYQAKIKQIENFSVLVSQVLVPPAMRAILSNPENRVQGFLAAGHVCTVMGYHQYDSIAKAYHVPIVVTGFEPIDIMQGVFMCIQQLEKGEVRVENQYARSVSREGNLLARQLIEQIFCIVKRKWRGIGSIDESGLALRDSYTHYDAEKRFSLSDYHVEESTECISGLILQGLKKPNECPKFSKECHPDNPLGATMVSSEGACAAYYRYRSIV